jgi:hypothetical protein
MTMDMRMRSPHTARAKHEQGGRRLRRADRFAQCKQEPIIPR